jgi:hypothetical protein
MLECQIAFPGCSLCTYSPLPCLIPHGPRTGRAFWANAHNPCTDGCDAISVSPMIRGDAPAELVLDFVEKYLPSLGYKNRGGVPLPQVPIVSFSPEPPSPCRRRHAAVATPSTPHRRRHAAVATPPSPRCRRRTAVVTPPSSRRCRCTVDVTPTSPRRRRHAAVATPQSPRRCRYAADVTPTSPRHRRHASSPRRRRHAAVAALPSSRCRRSSVCPARPHGHWLASLAPSLPLWPASFICSCSPLMAADRQDGAATHSGWQCTVCATWWRIFAA